MNRRKLINKSIVLGIVAIVLLAMIPPQCQANPAQELDYLIWNVADLNLQEGISNSLDAKLEAALRAKDNYNVNNLEGMMNALEAFINAVEVQRGKNISDDDADDFIYFVTDIIYRLERCGDYGLHCQISDCTCNLPCEPPCGGTY